MRTRSFLSVCHCAQAVCLWRQQGNLFQQFLQCTTHTQVSHGFQYGGFHEVYFQFSQVRQHLVITGFLGKFHCNIIRTKHFECIMELLLLTKGNQLCQLWRFCRIGISFLISSSTYFESLRALNMSHLAIVLGYLNPSLRLIYHRVSLKVIQ